MTNIKIDGVMVLTVAAAASAFWLWSLRGALGEKVNPASDKNIVFDNLPTDSPTFTGVADRVFSIVDLAFGETEGYKRVFQDGFI